MAQATTIDAKIEHRVALSVAVCQAVAEAEHASDAVSACLSVACAYLRLAEPEDRVAYAEDAAVMMVGNVRASLD
jgi:hypothetical protein